MADNLRNPCITMHQPWASLLVHGIKRVEGRGWPAPIRGRLWIHAAGKVPETETIKAMEDFYKEIYALDGITDIKFPENYPVSQLLGCVNVVGCVKREELMNWEELPRSVRLEAQTEYCWLCEDPQKLVVPFAMRGYQRVYNLEKKVFASAVRGLWSVQSPLPVKFPLPNPSNIFSLKPGSLAPCLGSSMESLAKSSKLDAAIAGAREAATQFSKKDSNQVRRTPSIADSQDSKGEDIKDLAIETGLQEDNWAQSRRNITSSKYQANRPELDRSRQIAPHSRLREAETQFSEKDSNEVRRMPSSVESEVSKGEDIKDYVIQTGLQEDSRAHSRQNITSVNYQADMAEPERPRRIAPSSRIFAEAVRGLRPK